jgi:hypothetical protein
MTSRKRIGALLGALAVAAAWGTLVAQGATGPQSATPVAPRREIQGEPQSPAISFIDSPGPMCYRPVAGTGACYINWNSLYVTASTSQYIISMTINIDDRLRAYHSGFFQTSMYVPGQMYAPGFKVTCGTPGVDGVPDMGNIYNYVIRASETGGLGAANYGSVTCPADVVRVFTPVIMKR